MLRVADLGFSYDGTPLLDAISFTVPPGAFVGILGPNGSGKSTLLRLCGGLLAPRTGTIAYRGRPLSNGPRAALARQIAYVPQEHALPFPLKVREVVGLGRLPYRKAFGLEGADDRTAVNAALAAVGCADAVDRSIHTLSGGERQRVFLARALAQTPALLLCDEPTTHLDIRHQRECLQYLQRLRAERGLTIIAVLHDLNLAAHHCDLVGLLETGRLHGFGPPAAVLTATTIARVFGQPMFVGRHPRTGKPYYVPDV